MNYQYLKIQCLFAQLALPLSCHHRLVSFVHTKHPSERLEHICRSAHFLFYDENSKEYLGLHNIDHIIMVVNKFVY